MQRGWERRRAHSRAPPRPSRPPASAPPPSAPAARGAVRAAAGAGAHSRRRPRTRLRNTPRGRTPPTARARLCAAAAGRRSSAQPGGRQFAPSVTQAAERNARNRRAPRRRHAADVERPGGKRGTRPAWGGREGVACGEGGKGTPQTGSWRRRTPASRVARAHTARAQRVRRAARHAAGWQRRRRRRSRAYRSRPLRHRLAIPPWRGEAARLYACLARSALPSADGWQGRPERPTRSSVRCRAATVRTRCSCSTARDCRPKWQRHGRRRHVKDGQHNAHRGGGRAPANHALAHRTAHGGAEGGPRRRERRRERAAKGPLTPAQRWLGACGVPCGGTSSFLAWMEQAAPGSPPAPAPGTAGTWRSWW